MQDRLSLCQVHNHLHILGRSPSAAKIRSTHSDGQARQLMSSDGRTSDKLFSIAQKEFHLGSDKFERVFSVIGLFVESLVNQWESAINGDIYSMHRYFLLRFLSV